MLYNDKLLQDNIYLRMVDISDCNENYLRWLNDEETNRYMETRWGEQTPESIKDFVKSVRESNHSYLFAIIYENKHVGNIKIGPIHSRYKFADISYFIGDKSMCGKGIATTAIKLICKFAFNYLKLNKVCAGVYEHNIASQKVLLKNGFSLEGIKRKHYYEISENDYCDIYEYGLLKENFK